jgi:type II secretory pathway pseudopilin PulG
MKINIDHNRSARGNERAFTIVELLVSSVLIVIFAVSLYSGMALGFSTIQMARENLRATQILSEKLETIRLYTWDQLNTPGFIPANFQEPFYVTDRADHLVYQGRFTISPVVITDASYSADLRRVRIDLNWTSGNVTHKRSMETWVSRHGLHRYLY